VDDDEDVRDMITLTLEMNGFEVEGAADGARALAMMVARRPCLVILDLVMPTLSGHEVLEQMQSRGIDVPVCVISALGTTTPGEAVASLAKPFEVKELTAVAGRYCTHRT
jgi:DNA-binding response OmpR family regulator